MTKKEKEQIINKIKKLKERVRKHHGTSKYDSCYNDCVKIIKNYEN